MIIYIDIIFCNLLLLRVFTTRFATRFTTRFTIRFTIRFTTRFTIRLTTRFTTRRAGTGLSVGWPLEWSILGPRHPMIIRSSRVYNTPHKWINGHVFDFWPFQPINYPNATPTSFEILGSFVHVYGMCLGREGFRNDPEPYTSHLS